jgi:hypothetical protein
MLDDIESNRPTEDKEYGVGFKEIVIGFAEEHRIEWSAIISLASEVERLRNRIAVLEGRLGR